MSVTRSVAASLALVIASSSAIAAVVRYDVSIVPNASSFVSEVGFDAPLAGTFIGNYDAKSNPSGTQTRPGLFGGSGNNPIGYSAVLGGDADVGANPEGGFGLLVDRDAGTLSIDGLELDLLGGDLGSILLSITINYSSFNTANPTAIFPGGFTIPLPLGTGDISAFTATQTGPAAGALVPTGKDTATFAVAVPADLLFTASFGGTEIGGTPLPALLPLVGSIDFGGENVVISFSTEQAFNTKTPLDPPLAFESLPLGLPTILPPGGTANLLFSGELTSFAFDWLLSLDVVADAAALPAYGDLDGDGVVGPVDLSILLGAWGSSGPGDLSGDGIVGAADLTLLLGAWG